VGVLELEKQLVNFVGEVRKFGYSHVIRLLLEDFRFHTQVLELSGIGLKLLNFAHELPLVFSLGRLELLDVLR